MRITYNDKLNKLLNPYLESLLKEKSSLEPETLTLFDLFMEDLDMGGRYGIFSEILEPRLEEIIREENIESIANLMDGRLNTLFRYMLGDEFAGLFHTYLQLEARCPHTIGYDRRAQRSAHPSNHLDHARDAWLQFLKLRATGFSVEAILKGGNTPEDTEEFSGYMNSSYWLAAQIAQGNEKVIEYLNQVLTSENNVHRLQRWYLHAIAISGHRPLLELEGKLLLAAKLQEGLRQAIVETMDEGCPESYLYLFSIIYNNGLQRFASVKRSIAVCTGIGEQDSSERITNKYVELIWNFLNHPETARNTLQSKDTVELYLALWSIGFYDTDEIRAIVPDIIRKGAKHQIQTLLYFLRCTQSSQMNHLISKDAFEVWHDDPKVVAAILPLYMDGLYLSRYSDNKEAPTLSDYFETPEQALDNVFLKGYQWPFDAQRCGGSSRIDLIVRHEIKDLGRRVFLDYRRNPTGLARGMQGLGKEAFRYLERSGVLGGTPVERLEKMNPEAVALYRRHGIDLYRERLEIGVCAQHHNGGIAVDSHWESSIPGLFAVGEAAGTFGDYRPGGAALNAAQVGALRAAEHIADVGRRGLPDASASAKAFRQALGALLEQAEGCMCRKDGPDPRAFLAGLQCEMSRHCCARRRKSRGCVWSWKKAVPVTFSGCAFALCGSCRHCCAAAIRF